MAAYAALVSAMNTMEQIMNHTRLSASFNNKQIESLREKVDFLLDFIESYTSHGGSQEALDLESQIASAAHAAEDMIESHVVDEIRNSSISLLNLQKVIEEMDSVKEKVMKVKEERRLNTVQLPHSISTSPTLSKPLTSAKTTTMVGLDDELIQLMDVLTGQESSRQVISIVGMGGIGKTTLTANAFDTPLIVHHFDVRGWVTISHDYSVRQILLELFSFLEIHEALEASEREIDRESEDQLGVKLYQALFGRRYLIVLDDIWSVECWDKMRFFFPDNDNGSRVVVTTRLSNVATQFCSSSLKIKFLDKYKSWDLFCGTAFLEEDCPLELEEIGKEIVKKCRGLPLSIVVIGAFLGKSSRRKEYWENIVRDIISILKSDEDELCLNLLSLSYSHLPAHLKPCFLYMGILQEDQQIHVSKLIKMFVAEGFLKPNQIQTLEEIAQDYLKDLVDRNLILVSKWRGDGTAKYYYIHDLLREVCLKEVEKEKFVRTHHVLDIPRGVDKESRRIVFHDRTTKNHRVFDALPSAELVRSLILKGGPLPSNFPLLKVLTKVDSDPLESVFKQVNLRYLVYKSSGNPSVMLPSSASRLWSLQTLIIRGNTKRIVAPSEIWYMRQLRHLECNQVCLPDPPPREEDQEDECVLQNLQTLTNIVNFSFSEDVCKRIPNVEELHILYDDFSSNSLKIDLDSLHKLQSLKCCLDKGAKWGDLVTEPIFPSSIKKLCLIGGCLDWENVTRVGMMLPRLEALKLDSVIGPEWNVDEGAFPRLKFFRISNSGLIDWTADGSHFPVLQKLHLRGLYKLEEIPLDFGEIPTLGYIKLWLCSESAAISSAKILKEQLSVGNEDIEVSVLMQREEEEKRLNEKAEKEKFPRKNFQCKSDERVNLIQKIRMHARVIREAVLFREAGSR